MAYIGRSPTGLNPAVAPPPNVPVEIDWTHPLANGLVEWFLLGSGGASSNGLVKGSPSSIIGGSAYIATAAGVGLSFNGSSQFIDTGYAFDPVSAPAVFTVSAVIVISSFSGTGAIVGGANTTGTLSPSFDNCVEFRVNTSGGLDLVRQNQALVGSSANVLALNTPTHVSVTYDASGNFVFYINGAAHGAANSAQSFIQNIMAIGAAASFPPDYFAGDILEVKWHNRALSPSEALSLGTQPYAMLRPKLLRRRYVPGGGTAFSATAGLGTLTIAGQQPSLAAGASLAAGLGTLALSGRQPALSAGAAFASGLGTLSITGLQPGVTAGASFTAGQGALAITGRQASVSAGVAAQAGLGALAIAGYAPGVAAGASITAGLGALATQGYAPAVSAGVLATAGFGTLALTGYAPGLVTGVNAVAGLGAVVIQGYQASVTVSGFVFHPLPAGFVAVLPPITRAAVLPPIDRTAIV